MKLTHTTRHMNVESEKSQIHSDSFVVKMIRIFGHNVDVNKGEAQS